MNQNRNRGWGIALTVVSAITATISLAACTPPMPPDVLAAQAENQITCQTGSQDVLVPEEFSGSVDSVSVTLNGVCPEQSMVEVSGDTPAGVVITTSAPTVEELAAFGEQCTAEIITVPIFSYGVTLAYNIIGLEGLILDANVLGAILSGSITAWDDPAIAALNPGYDLTGLPEMTFMSVEGGSGSVEAMTTYISNAAPEAWPLGAVRTLEIGQKFPTELDLINEMFAIEGAVAVLPIVQAINNQIPMAATQVQEEIISPDDTQLQKVGSGAMTVTEEPTSLIATPATGGVPVEGNFDIAASKIVLADGQPLIGWPILGTAHATLCNTPGEPLPLSTVQFLERLSGQGSFETYGLTPLPEPIRVQTFLPLQVTLNETVAPSESAAE
jgi:ABC-type phosphate transport system substrate-binding protein